MADFNSAVTILLHHEGGYTNHPNDPGGATRYGVSLKYLKSQNLVDADFDKDGDIDIDDVRLMPVEQAKEIYRKDFWERNRLTEVTNQKLANMILGLSVNMGTKKAIGLLQKTINDLIQEPIQEDGKLGAKTLFYVNNLMPGTLLREYMYVALSYYEHLIKANPNLKTFRKGWWNRLKSYVY